MLGWRNGVVGGGVVEVLNVEVVVGLNVEAVSSKVSFRLPDEFFKNHGHGKS